MTVPARKARDPPLRTPVTIVDAIEDEFRRRDAERLDLQLCNDGITTGAEKLIRSEINFDPVALNELPFGDEEAA